MASSSSSSSPATRYDVFLNFRGEDTRDGFIGHLHKALCNNQIFTFIDYHLAKGDDIPPSLFTAIEESMISIIIFSEDYANSKWCLKELAKILQCKHLNSQIVIPVFYGVDPSHIRNQTEKVGIAFDKLKERLQEGQMDLNEVRSHLEEAANMSGWVSQDFSSESKLIEAIVGDVLNKLNLVTMNLPTSFVGISSHVEQVETLLCLDSPKFRIVGLWGMGGIGKTTIAQAVFNRIYSRFDGFHFVEDVSKEFKSRSVSDLREEIVLKLFEEERLKMGNRTLRPDFITKQFQRKKVLLVLDDLEDVLLAKKLLDGHLFCGGSRVLVTSRDKQVLKNIVGDRNQIYEVRGLSEEGGLQLFSLHAFKLNHPTSDRLKLSKRVLSYARGNPLALVVLGCALFDKSKEEWVSALDGIGDEPFPDIQKVLRISYDALSVEEKTIFLDISVFLVGKKLDFVAAYYEGSVRKIVYKIRNLVDKSLITIAENEQLEMHDLLKEMGCSIESAKRPEERTRIWNLKDVTHVFKKKKASSMIEDIKVNICSVFARLWDFKDVIGVSKKRKESSMIEAISVNLCQGERISEFDCNVLARLDRLRFLEFLHRADLESKVRFCWEGFRGFPEELRYFRWDAYPHKSLPSNFCVENLVELHMPRTTIRKLWTGKQNIVNLKVINLEGARKLVKFPDVSEGKNIQKINLEGCKSLVKLPPSIQHLPKLEILNLSICSSLESVPTTFDSKVLQLINLNGCGGVKMFPQLASANIIIELNLGKTDIREVPSSVELLKGLKWLPMSGCEKLSIISTNICKLKSLWKLDLGYCTNLESFPEIMEPMESLKRLELGGCTRLKRLPNDDSFHNLKSLEELHLDDTAITELPSSIQHLICLKKLKISGCQNLTSLPSFIHNQRMLELYLDRCSNLCSLPELPSSLETLSANGCVSLKTISSACSSSESRIKYLDFANCFESDEEERRRVLDIAFSNLQYVFDWEFLKKRRRLMDAVQGILEEIQGIQEERRRVLGICEELVKEHLGSLNSLNSGSVVEIAAQEIQKERTIGLDIASSLLEGIQEERRRVLGIGEFLLIDLNLEYRRVRVILPWSEIPQLFCGSQNVGSSLTLKLPMDDDRRYIFAFCFVIKSNYGNSVDFRMNCHVDDTDACVTRSVFFLKPSDTEHLLLWFDGDIALRKYFGREVSLQFGDIKGHVEVRKCGVLIFSEEDIRNAESYS